MTGPDAVAGVVKDLEDWAARFLEAVRARSPQRAEEAVGGLVDWLGHDLVDAFLSMDVPTWEALSGLAEELFQTLRAARAGPEAGGGVPAGAGPEATAVAIEGILSRARAIRDGRGHCGR